MKTIKKILLIIPIIALMVSFVAFYKSTSSHKTIKNQTIANSEDIEGNKYIFLEEFENVSNQMMDISMKLDSSNYEISEVELKFFDETLASNKSLTNKILKTYYKNIPQKELPQYITNTISLNDKLIHKVDDCFFRHKKNEIVSYNDNVKVIKANITGANRTKTIYYEDGTLREFWSELNGVKNGMHTHYYSSGKLKTKKYYVNGNPYHSVATFSESNEKLLSGNLLNGNGYLIDYSSNNDLIEDVNFFELGKLINNISGAKLTPDYCLKIGLDIVVQNKQIIDIVEVQDNYSSNFYQKSSPSHLSHRPASSSARTYKSSPPHSSHRPASSSARTYKSSPSHSSHRPASSSARTYKSSPSHSSHRPASSSARTYKSSPSHSSHRPASSSARTYKSSPSHSSHRPASSSARTYKSSPSHSSHRPASSSVRTYKSSPSRSSHRPAPSSARTRKSSPSRSSHRPAPSSVRTYKSSPSRSSHRPASSSARTRKSSPSRSSHRPASSSARTRKSSPSRSSHRPASSSARTRKSSPSRSSHRPTSSSMRTRKSSPSRSNYKRTTSRRRN